MLFQLVLLIVSVWEEIIFLLNITTHHHTHFLNEFSLNPFCCACRPSKLVLEWYCWYTANILTTTVFDALSIGNGLVTAVLLWMKRGRRFLMYLFRLFSC